MAEVRDHCLHPSYCINNCIEAQRDEGTFLRRALVRDRLGLSVQAASFKASVLCKAKVCLQDFCGLS